MVHGVPFSPRQSFGGPHGHRSRYLAGILLLRLHNAAVHRANESGASSGVLTGVRRLWVGAEGEVLGVRRRGYLPRQTSSTSRESQGSHRARAPVHPSAPADTEAFMGVPFPNEHRKQL